MNNDLLPSPSNFFSEWYDSSGRNGLGSAVLPSPLVFQTPNDARNTLGFGLRDAAREAESGEKRKESVAELEGKDGDGKKIKTGAS
jgi:hypothetical protein